MTSSTLRMQHTSLQFSDTREQQEHDLRKIFVKGKTFPIKTGTEAGPDEASHNANRQLLKRFADEYNHRLHFARDNWIAVDRKIIKPKSVRTGEVFVVENDKTLGHGHDSVMATMGFTHADPRIGRINVGAVHYPTKGQTPKDPNHEWNRLYAQRIGEYLRRVARGSALGFVNGDFNMPDHLLDWAFGGNFTSMADELKAWENTGHGPIDGFCSFDKDGRVKAKSYNAVPDSGLHLFSDHYLVRGVWTVRHLKK